MGVDRLSSGDRFNIIRFSNTASSLYQEPQPVSEASRALASHFIASLRADGGTQMRPPLELAFAAAPSDGLLRQIVFITDGSVGNEAEIISLIRKNIGDARLFTVGIGGSPNAFFLQEAAGRGTRQFVSADLAFFSFCASQRGFRHNLFDFSRVAGQAFAEKCVAGFGDEDVVLDAHAQIFLGNVDAGLDGDDHAGLERGAGFTRVVNVQADVDGRGRE